MDEWTRASLDDIATIVTGGTPPASQPDSWGNDVDFITPSDQYDGQRDAIPSRRLSKIGAERLSNRLVPALSTNLTCIGSTIGKVSMAAAPSVTNQQINTLVAKPGITDPLFLYYTIKNWSGALKGHASGSATPIVNKSVLARYEFEIPPLEDQRAIGEVLGALDDKIAANTKLAETAMSLSEELFHHVIRDASVLCSLGHLLSLEYGKALPSSKRVEGNVTVFGSGGVVGSHDQALKNGPGIVVGRKGSAGVVHWSPGPFFPIDTTYYVEPKLGHDTLTFCYHMLKSLKLAEMNSDSAVPGLNRNEAHATKIQSISTAAIKEFGARTRPMFEVAAQYEQENRTLAATRDALLPQLMSGKLRVKDIENTMGEMV